ncbi:type II toxin-antitoxin system prevent-host-death family antitoxin [Microbacterium panaciterrae]
MSTISHREMRDNGAEVLRRVEAGETITVTNRGEPVADLSPIHRSVLDELRAAGQTRPATRDRGSLGEIVRAKLPDGVTTADIIADVRGHERGY